MRRPASRLAMAAAALVLMASWLLTPSKTFALGDLISPIVDARTARFRMTVKMERQPKVLNGTGYFLAPNRLRQEFPEMTSVSDFDRGRMVTLIPGVKQALIVDMKGRRDADRPAENYFANLRATLARYREGRGGEVKDLGEKEVDGKKLVGFALSTPGQLTTIWGDPATGRPARIEADMSGPVKTEVVFSDIAFDLALDETLFALDPPADYKRIEASFDATPPSETDFIAALGRLAGMNDGVFPGSFDAASLAGAFARRAVKIQAEGGDADQNMKTLMADGMSVGRGLSFATLLPRDADAQYAGNKVRSDGPKVAIFWYRPAGSLRYRVVGSDLSVADSEAAPKVEGAISIYPALPKGDAK